MPIVIIMNETLGHLVLKMVEIDKKKYSRNESWPSDMSEVLRNSRQGSAGNSQGGVLALTHRITIHKKNSMCFSIVFHTSIERMMPVQISSTL